MKIQLPNEWAPRHYQDPVWRYLHSGGRHAELVWHRRAGKDDLSLHWAATASHERVGNYWHMLPRANQSRKAIWDAVNPHTSRRRIDDAFPLALRETTKDNEMMIKLKCGSTWQVLGSDNFQGAIGSSPVGIVYSEWAQSNPQSRGYLRPILAENKGWQVFITTPRGMNHAYRSYDVAKKDKNAFAQLLTADDTGVFTPDELQTERSSYMQLHGEDLGLALFDQEYYCSFSAAIPGAYYAGEFRRIEESGRIADVPYDSDAMVHTAWDLGYSDDVVIFWFQIVAGEIHVIDYYENNFHDIPHYADIINSKPYRYGWHWVPHDAKAKTLASGGKSIQEQLQKLVSGTLALVPGLSLSDGIQASRAALRRAWFDAEKCADAVEKLKQYQREWNEDRQCFNDKPLHDYTSHCADAWRYLAVAWRKEVTEEKPQTIEEMIAEMTRRPTLNELWDEHRPRAERV